MTENVAPQQLIPAGARDVHGPIVPGNGAESNGTGPYAQGAPHYFNGGWLGILPVDLKGLDKGKAGVVPDGFTGGDGAWPTAERIGEWWRTHGHYNVGLRLPDDVLGIDVDCYDGKQGCETLYLYETNAGPLPPTWISTARSDGSGIRFFRVPSGRKWVSNVKPGIEIIRFAHRWARVWPSVNPRIRLVYRWIAPDATVADRVPSPGELPELPEAWVEVLTVGSASSSTSWSGAGSTDNGDDRISVDIDAWMAEAPSVPSGGQREHLLRGVGWMRQRAYSLSSARIIAWTVASQYTNYDESNPWTQDNVQEVVDDCWNRYDAGPLAELTPELLALARSITSGNGAAPQEAEEPQPAAIPAMSPDAMRMLEKEALRQWIAREAGRQLDAWELARARGSRLKRTARQYAAVPQPDTVIDEVLAAEVNLLGGPSEAGKSLLARDWALSVATGQPWWGHAVPEARTVLWIASEGLHDFKERWVDQPGWEQAADRIFILEEPVDLVRGDDADWLLKEYAGDPGDPKADPPRKPPGLVVFDVIYGMGLPDDNGTKDVVPLLSAMKRISAAWGAATLPVGHPGHNGERRFRGSSAWRQLAATEWHLADGALSCEKSKIADKRRVGGSVAVAYPNIQRANLGDVAKVAAERDRLIRADIESHPRDSNSARARRLYGALGVSERTARRLVATLLGVEEDSS